MASRPAPEFNRFEAQDLLEALENADQGAKHAEATYYKFTFKTLRGKIDGSNDQFRNFLLPLLGDKDQGKVLDVVAIPILILTVRFLKLTGWTRDLTHTRLLFTTIYLKMPWATAIKSTR